MDGCSPDSSCIVKLQDVSLPLTKVNDAPTCMRFCANSKSFREDRSVSSAR